MGLGFRVWVLGLGVRGSGVWVLGLGGEGGLGLRCLTYLVVLLP